MTEEEQNELDFLMNISADVMLKDMVSFTKNLEIKDSTKLLDKYLYGRVTPRVCILQGPCGTGKTTTMFQAIANMTEENFSKTIYIEAQKHQTMKMLEMELKQLFYDGYRYIFIDDVTKIDGFTDYASVLSDIYAAMGMKIVLSSNDIEAIEYLKKYELYDRAYSIKYSESEDI